MQQIVPVNESVTVRAAAEFHQLLLGAAEQDGDATLDIAHVVEVDLSFVQTLSAARTRFAAEGRTLRLATPAPEPVAALLARAGFLTDPAPSDIDFWFHGVLPQ